MIEIVTLLAILHGQATPANLYLRRFDVITQIHIESILIKHRIDFHIEVSGGFEIIINSPPKNLLSLLSAEAPPNSFPVFIQGHRNVDDSHCLSEWTSFTRSQIHGAALSPFSLAPLLAAAGLRDSDVVAVKYIARPYTDIDQNPRTGFEVFVSAKGKTMRCQVFSKSKGRQDFLWNPSNLEMKRKTRQE